MTSSIRTSITKTLLLAAATTAAVALHSTAAADWGSLKGRFVVDGAPPALPPLVISKDQHCIDSKPVNETVVIGDGGGLANAVVYVFLGRRGSIDVHPDYEAELEESVVLDNIGCHFVPHVARVRTGQTFVLKNSDPVGHNTNVTGIFNEIIPAGDERPKTFNRAESLPIPVTCNIHPWMKGHVLVQEHPYMAVSGEDGTFEIKNIPAGNFNFQFWHETGYLRDLRFSGGSTNRRGQAELTIAAGETLDLGDIQVPANMLR
jgi:plastocyanin